MEKEQSMYKRKIFSQLLKQFLYSDTEIFLRELVSNAVDASQKLMTLNQSVS